MPLPLRPITDDDSQSTVVDSGRRPSPQRPPGIRASVITGGGQPLSPGSVALPTDVAVVGQVRAGPFLPPLSRRSLPGSTPPPRRSLPQVKPITRPSFSRPTRASFQQHHANRPSILASAAHVAQAAQAVLSVVGNQPAPPKEPSIRGGVRPSPLTRETSSSGQQGGALGAGRGASFKAPAESAGAGGRVVGPPPMVRGASGRPVGSFRAPAAAAPSSGGGSGGGQSDDAAAADGAPGAAAAAAAAGAVAVYDAAVGGKQIRASFGARRADKPLAEPPQRRPSYLNKVPPAASERPTGAPSLVGAGAVPTGAGEKPEPARRPSFNRGRRVG